MNHTNAPALRARRSATVFACGMLLASVLALTVGVSAAHAEDTAEGEMTVTVPTAAPTPTTPPVTTPPVTTPPVTTPPVTTTTPKSTGGTTTPTPQETPAPTEPAIPGAPAANGAEAKVDGETYQAGASVVVTADGFTPGEQVQVVLFSDPQLIGNVAANADGTFEHSFALPDDLAAGRHTVQLTGWASKHIATADVFVTTGPLAADASVPVIPTAVWWVLGILAVLLLAGAFWWVIRIMRAPTAEVAPA
ncbi:hypothetical protein [Salinibacterium sp. ZJ454]|uniref:hypothetical protein n=1 Tax=Salinibacterium sp. ZJ454 TaxID=2708339 RepID=UPI0014232927|nr:hypothetical protein [Salinibacterium sp. ZJ454]